MPAQKDIAQINPSIRSVEQPPARRIPQLDGVRAIAILMVLVWHYFNGNWMMTDHWSTTAHIIARLESLLWSGVDLFFVLSGFLLGGILLDNLGAKNYFRVFYLRRACRILPIYYVVLGVFILLKSRLQRPDSPVPWLFHPSLPTWTYAVFAQNIAMGLKESPGPGWLGMTWSLAVEEHFYFVLPLLIYFVPRRALLYVVTLFAITAPVFRCLSPGFHAFVNMPWRADSLLAGVALSILIRSGRFMALARSHSRFVLILFSILLGGALVSMLANFHTSSLDAYNHSWLAALYAVFILLSILKEESLIGRALKFPVLGWIGTISYGVYIYHEQILGCLFGLLRGHQPYINSLADLFVTLLALLTTFTLAALSYYFFERPILRFAHKTKYIHPAASLPNLNANSFAPPADSRTESRASPS
jgi:peptidoglycan/LPS O-acetylase OafA/YrhL